MKKITGTVFLSALTIKKWSFTNYMKIVEISKNPNLNLYQCICAMEKERKKEKVQIKQKTIFDA